MPFPFDPKASLILNPHWPFQAASPCIWMLRHCFLFRMSKKKKKMKKLAPGEQFCPTPQQDLSLSVGLPWAKAKIKTNGTLISGPCFPLLSCRQKEPSPGRLPQIKASCSPLAASPIRITTTKPAETIIYSFWCGFWSYPTSSTMPPHHHPLPSPLLFLTQPLQLSVSFTPKETRSCQLLRKGGCFEGAGVPESTPFSYFTPRKVCRSLRKKFSQRRSTYRHPAEFIRL